VEQAFPLYLWALTPFIKFFRGDDAKKKQDKVEEEKDEEHKKTFGEGPATQDNEKNPLISSPLFNNLNF